MQTMINFKSKRVWCFFFFFELSWLNMMWSPCSLVIIFTAFAVVQGSLRRIKSLKAATIRSRGRGEIQFSLLVHKWGAPGRSCGRPPPPPHPPSPAAGRQAAAAPAGGPRATDGADAAAAAAVAPMKRQAGGRLHCRCNIWMESGYRACLTAMLIHDPGTSSVSAEMIASSAVTYRYVA